MNPNQLSDLEDSLKSLRLYLAPIEKNNLSFVSKSTFTRRTVQAYDDNRMFRNIA